MVAARRAMAASDEVADLGVVVPARRADEAPSPLGRQRIVRLALAPVALLSVVGLAAGLMTIPAPSDVERTDPHLAIIASPMAVSRNDARQELWPVFEESPTVAPSERVQPTIPAAASSTPSATPSATAPVASPTPEASPAVASAAPTPTASAAKPDPAVLGKKAGVRYATSSLNIRTGPGTDFDSRTTVSEGRELTITDQVVNGWQQVSLSGKAGWVKASYLSDKAPAKPAPKATSAKATPAKAASAKAATSDTAADTAPASSGGFSSAACSKASGIESGLTSRTRSVLRAVCAQFPKVSSYGGRRAGGGSFHGSGRAIDVMVSGSYGWEIAKWARANAGALGITEVIYEQKIWTSQRSGDGWRGMSSRGSVSANHYDHVHISVR